MYCKYHRALTIIDEFADEGLHIFYALCVEEFLFSAKRKMSRMSKCTLNTEELLINY